MKNNIFYVCSLIEFIARSTKNHIKDVGDYFSIKDIERQLRIADVNHCLSFEQVCEETVETFHIINGNYDFVAECKYKVPTFTAIGKVYQTLILNVIKENDNVAQIIKQVLSSFITDEISYYNSNVYYSNPDYLKCCYLEGKML